MVSCDQIPTQLVLPDQPKVCCVYGYDAKGHRTGTNTCTEIDALFTAADCTSYFNFTPTNGDPTQLQVGEVQECCRDCNPPPKKLILSGGRLVRNGGALNMSPDAEPEKCCCGDECVCKQVPEGCEQVRCYPTRQPTDDDKCKGRCVIRTYDAAGNEILDDRTMICATKLQCCAEDYTTCTNSCVDGSLPPVSQPARDAIPAANQWDAMPCTTCGVCCVINYDSDPASPTFRQPLGRTGTRNLTEEECEAQTVVFFPNPAPLPVGEWHPTEDNINICNPACCQTQQLGDKKQASCAHTSATTCNPCLGNCVELKRENSAWLCPRSECKTKQECCGEGGEKCTPQCDNPTADYAWSPLSCSDGDKCGKCCQYIWDPATGTPGGPVNNYSAIICDTGTNTKAECERYIELPSGVNKPYGIWYPFGTCADCNPTPCCREITCPDGKTRAICVNVEPQDCNRCNGRCTDLSTLQQSCKTKQACCGNDGKKCETACGVDATHSWTAACANGQLCGACCRIVSDSANNILAATCLPNITRAIDCVLTPDDIAAQQPNNVITYSWRPFETCATAKCSQKKCCGELCPDSVGCIDVDVDAPCDYCKGRCYTVDAAGIVDLTQPATCATKASCCIQDGINVCQNECKPGKRWEPTCPENSLKCGVACKTTFDGGTILSSICQPGITTYQQYETAKAELPANQTLTWKPWDTCATAICKSKKCCKEKCPGVLGCVDVDESDACKPCSGLCYAAVIDPGTNNYVIAPDAVPECRTRRECCGGANEKCAFIASCPTQTDLKVFVSCDNNCPSGDCLCTDANYAANNDIRTQTRTEPVSGRLFTHWVIAEQCRSLLARLPDPGLPLNNFVPYFNNFVNGSAYSLTYVPVQGPWIEDPCYTSCGEPPTGDDPNETQYEQCVGEQSQLFTTPYEFKPCYPAVLAGQKVYAYAEWCSYAKHPSNYAGNTTGYTSTKAGALAFYMCKDKKLVNVTDDIITKKTVKKCSDIFFIDFNGFSPTNPVRVNTDVDLFNWKFCYTETTTGAVTERKGDFSQSCFSGLNVCGDYASPSSEIKDPDMLGCPQPFTANPLP